MAANSQAAKLQQHLELLKEQYVRLQQRHADLEHKYTQAVASSGSLGPEHFVTKLVGLVTTLYEKQLYSDIAIELADRTFPGHRFVLAARGSNWCSTDDNLSTSTSLDLRHLTPHVATLLLRWLYTDAIFLPSDQTSVIELLSASNTYQLPQLKEKCEQALMSSVTVRNCISLYQTSELHSAQLLKAYCLQIISNHWNDLDTADFAQLSAPLLYDMFKAHSSYPLHLAIQHQREDVVFMFIIEYNSELPGKLNELDDRGNIPLNLALLNRNEGIANTLVSNRCNLDVMDRNGHTLLHLAILRGDIFACKFLIQKGANCIQCHHKEQLTPLHLVSLYNQASAVKFLSDCLLKDPPAPADGLSEISQMLLEYHANPDAQDSSGFTPLQRAIDTSNTDVFEVLLKNSVLNLELRNNNGSTALWLALNQLKGESDKFANRLIERGADPDAIDNKTGNSLLHLAAMEGNEKAAIFLVCHGGKVDHTNHQGEAPIHIASMNNLHVLVQMLLQYGADPNLRTNLKSVRPQVAPIPTITTTSQSDVMSPVSTLGALSALSNMATMSGSSNSIDSAHFHLQQLSNLSNQGSPALSQRKTSNNPFGDDEEEEEIDNRLGNNRSSTGYSITPLNRSTNPSPQIEHKAVKGEVKIVKEFIDEPEKFNTEEDPGRRTALHLAIINKHPEVVNVLLAYKESGTGSGKIEIALNVGLKDGGEETPLSLALWTGQLDVALKLLDSGADLECQRESDGMTLLYQAIVREQPTSSLFLLDHGASFKKKTAQNESLLLVAIRHQLEPVVHRLCDLGVDVGVTDTSGNSPLWVALRSRQKSIAAKLTSHGCDPNGWHTTPEGTSLSLLHRAINLNDTPTACFLIKSGADVNGATRPANASQDYSTPLHMASERGLKDIVQCLVDHHADPNAKDSYGRTAIHTAISNHHPDCAQVLLQQPSLDLSIKDKSNQTPFAAALSAKDNETGCAILKREPKAAEQMDSRGQNFLHLAVLNQDVESVIFLLSVAVDVNSKVQNPTMNTPLHYAVKGGAEIILRHLLLAMGDVHAVDNHNRGVLHLAVEGNFSTILSILLEHGANPDHVDEEGNNALHIAMQLGHEDCIRILLNDSDINLTTVNMRGRNCLHMLSASPKSNASILFHLLSSVAPKFPVNLPDDDGYTPLLLAYIAGNSSLCESLVGAGAHPGMCTKQKLSIFNAPVATKQLLFRILEQLQVEPTWLDGQNCMNCDIKFNISHRKHHCRHCGRLLCNKCTSQQMPIVKFDLNKPVRVCEICGDSFRLSSDY